MLEIAQIYHVLSLELRKKLLNLRSIMVKGPESSLNSDLYRINITNDPKCQCGAPYEDSIHYLMECPLYQKREILSF